ncbi:flagellar basal body-associated FliL family protein [bacterium]|nr:flagellar basal body-associated FliL family protein [bacterium]
MAEAEEPKSPPAAKKSMFPLLMLVGVVVFVGLAVGVFLLLRDGGGDEPVLADPKSGAGPVETAFRFPGDDAPLKVQTNLMGGHTFIQADLWLELNVERNPSDKKERDRKKKLEDELKSKIPKIQEAVTEVFNTTSAETLESVQARDGLKDKIKSRINRFLVNGQIQDIIMTQITQPVD